MIHDPKAPVFYSVSEHGKHDKRLIIVSYIAPEPWLIEKITHVSLYVTWSYAEACSEEMRAVAAIMNK